MTVAALRPRIAGAAVAAGLVVGVWTALATWWAPRVTPTVPTVVRQVWNDRSFYVPHVRTTVAEAAWGYVIGNVAAIAMATLIVLVRPLSAVLERIGVAVYCLPLLALGPILQIVAPGSSAKVALAAVAVFFTTMVCCVVGLRSADPASIDVVPRRQVVTTAGRSSPCAFRQRYRRCSPGCASPPRQRCSARSSVSTSVAAGGSAWR